MSGAGAEVAGPTLTQVEVFLSRLNGFTRTLIIPLYVETAFFGAFSLLLLVTSYILLRWGLRSRSGQLMFAVILIMYINSTIQWALHLTLTWVELSVALPAILDPTVVVSENAFEGIGLLAAAPNIPMTINIVFSDAVVLWRTCVIWLKNRVVVGISIFLVLLTASLYTAVTVARVSPILNGQLPINTVLGVLGPTAFSISFLTNVWATSMTAFKAWQNRHLIKVDFKSNRGRSAVESILVLIVESGSVYCVLWLVYLLDSSTPFSVFGQFGAYLSLAMNQLVGLYPTLIVLLVAMQRSTIDRQVEQRRGKDERPVVLVTTTMERGQEQQLPSVVAIGDSFGSEALQTVQQDRRWARDEKV